MAPTEEMIQKRLKQVKSAQDSVEAISSWILHHIKFVTTISRVWLDVFLISNDDLQINLVYVLNDVCQKSRKIEKDLFVKVISSFYYHLRAVVPFASKSVRTKIERVIGILKDREIFSKRKVDEIAQLIAGETVQVPKIPENSGKRPNIWFTRLQQIQTQHDKYQQLVDKCLENEGILKPFEHASKRTPTKLSEKHHIDIVRESGKAISSNINKTVLHDLVGKFEKKNVKKTELYAEMDEFDGEVDTYKAAAELSEEALLLSTHALQSCTAVKFKEDGRSLSVHNRATLGLTSSVSNVSASIPNVPKTLGVDYNTWKHVKKERLQDMRRKIAESDQIDSDSPSPPKKASRSAIPPAADDSNSVKFLESIPLPQQVESIPLPPTSNIYEVTPTIQTYAPTVESYSPVGSYDPRLRSSYPSSLPGPIPSASRSSIGSNYDYQTYDDCPPPGVDVHPPPPGQAPPAPYDPNAYSPTASYYPSSSAGQTYPMMPTTSYSPPGAPSPYSPPAVGGPFAYPSTPQPQYFSPPTSQSGQYHHTPRRY